jgi:hypothetical protein
MDAFDYRDDKPKTGLSRDVIWNILSILMLLSIVCIVGYSAMIYANPTSSLNPFPPREFKIPTWTPLPPTATSTKVVALPATWTPPPSPTITLTATPRPTSTPFVTDTPLPSGSNPEPTLTPGGMSYAPQGDPQVIRDFAHEECKWMGVAGQVFDLKGSAVVSLIVQLGGSINGQLFETQTSITGLAQQYGPGGFEFTIANAPVATNQTLWVQLVDQAGLPLSNKIYFSTVDDCQKNLVVISFKQMK